MKPWMLSLEEFAEIYTWGYPYSEFQSPGIVRNRYSLYETNPIGSLPMRDEILNMINDTEHKKKMSLIESAMNL